MMTEEQRKQAISSLTQATRTKITLPAANRPLFPSIEIEDPNAISSAMAELKVRAAQDSRPQNWIDLQAMQASSQIDEPDYGHLFDDMLITGRSQGATCEFLRAR